MAENIYNWQFNCLPGSANQGAILMTRNNILRPPFTQDDFVWLAMEDVIGTADVRLTYNEKTNIYTLEKAIGHRNNDGEWTKDWYAVGSWERLSQEVTEILRQLTYVEYRYDTSIPNVLKVIGAKKDLTEVVLCDISFVSLQEFNQAISTLDEKIETERSRAIARENEIEQDIIIEVGRAKGTESQLREMIEAATMNPGQAIEVLLDKTINVLFDNTSIKLNNSNQLKADVFDDTSVSNTKGWSSAKISQEMTSAMHYKGQVATYEDLPMSGNKIGDLYNVVDTGDNYAWNGLSWDKQSGDYIAGAGIAINGKVISASGIAFGVGNGLEVFDDEGNSVLRIKTDNFSGLYFASDGTIRINTNNLESPIYVGQDGNLRLGYSTDDFGYDSTESELRIRLNTNGGLGKTYDGLEVKTQTPIGKNSEGIRLSYDDNTLLVENGQLATKLKTWTGTQSEYNELGSYDNNTLYMIHE